MKELDPLRLEQLRDSAKADLAATTLGEAIKMCIAAAGAKIPVSTASSMTAA
jgi:hypothetical protein